MFLDQHRKPEAKNHLHGKKIFLLFCVCIFLVKPPQMKVGLSCGKFFLTSVCVVLQKIEKLKASPGYYVVDISSCLGIFQL